MVFVFKGILFCSPHSGAVGVLKCEEIGGGGLSEAA